MMTIRFLHSSPDHLTVIFTMIGRQKFSQSDIKSSFSSILSSMTRVSDFLKKGRE